MANQQTRYFQKLAHKNGNTCAYCVEVSYTGKTKAPIVTVVEREHGANAFRQERAFLKNKRRNQTLKHGRKENRPVTNLIGHS